jgi:N-acetylglucosaminyl-diphospho-decaprenol L-rhamnosyltransferase
MQLSVPGELPVDVAATLDAPTVPTLDVVLVAYRSGAVLRRCLEQVARFVPPGSRIVVVDNSPEDESAAQAVLGIPNAVCLPQAGNIGYAAAVNRGIASTGGDVVLIVNPDIAAISGDFQEVVRIFDAEPRAAGVAVKIVDESGTAEHCRRLPRRADVFLFGLGGPDGFLARKTGYATQPLRSWAQDEEREVEQGSGSLLFLRRSAIDDVGELDERFFMYFEETDWLVRAEARGWHLIFTPRIQAVHLGQRSSQLDASQFHQYLLVESAYKFMRKHYGPVMTGLLRFVWLVADLARLVRGVVRSHRYRAAVRARLRLHLAYRTPKRP